MSRTEHESSLALGRSSGYFGAMRYSNPEKYEYIMRFPGDSILQKYNEYVAHISRLCAEFCELDRIVTEKGIRVKVAREAAKKGIMRPYQYYYKFAADIHGKYDFEATIFNTVKKLEAVLPILRKYAKSEPSTFTYERNVAVELGFSPTYIRTIRTKQPDKWAYIQSYGLPLKEAMQKYLDEVESEVTRFLDLLYDLRKAGKFCAACKVLVAARYIKNCAELRTREWRLENEIELKRLRHAKFEWTKEVNNLLKRVLSEPM